MPERKVCNYKALYSSFLYIFDVANKHVCDQSLFGSLAFTKHQLGPEIRIFSKTHAGDGPSELADASGTTNRALPLVARLCKQRGRRVGGTRGSLNGELRAFHVHFLRSSDCEDRWGGGVYF